MKKFTNAIIYTFVGIFSFIFFLYLSFPYNILKETIALELSNALGVSVTIKDLGPRFFVGLNAEGIKFGSYSKGDVELKKVGVNISLLSLLLAKAKVNIGIQDSTGGTLDLDLGFGIFDIISGTVLPSSIAMTSEKFTFGNFVELGLKMQAAAPSTSPLLKPVLEKISVLGKLTSNIDMDINTSDFSRSTGSLDINLVEATIDFDPAMQIPSQRFESAVIKANMQGGNFVFDPQSRFKTKDLNIALSGKIIEKTRIEQSILDIEIKVELFKELKETFGVIFNAVAGKEIEGKLNLKIAGPLIPGPEFKFL
jgi:type II secretion system protein N